MRKDIDDYLAGLGQVLSGLPREPIEMLVAELTEIRARGRRVFIFGNGGSAATASHMACDLSKNASCCGQPRLRAVSLCDGVPTLTAFANDCGYEDIFGEQLLCQAEASDLAIAISGSGNSPNVLRAVETARGMGLRTVGMTGGTGGRLSALVDICIAAPSERMEQIEDCHLVIDHLVTSILRAACNNGQVPSRD